MNANGEFVTVFDGERVTISKDAYKRLLKAKEFKIYLEANGVDNWPGYSEALNDSYDCFGQSYWEVCEGIDKL